MKNKITTPMPQQPLKKKKCKKYLNSITHGQFQVKLSEPELREIATVPQYFIKTEQLFKEKGMLQEGLNSFHCLLFQLFAHDFFPALLRHQGFQHGAHHVQLYNRTYYTLLIITAKWMKIRFNDSEMEQCTVIFSTFYIHSTMMLKQEIHEVERRIELNFQFSTTKVVATKQAWKGLKPWPPWCRCSALPVDLSSLSCYYSNNTNYLCPGHRPGHKS